MPASKIPTASGRVSLCPIGPTMAKIKTLYERIGDASAELKLARRDGSAEWIGKAARKLDELIDELPRTKQPQP